MLTKKTCLELLKVLGSRTESLVYIINSTVSTINMIFPGGKTVKEPNPWYIFLQVKGKIAGQSYRCGASLINDRWAVTAAHCLCFEVTILQLYLIVAGLVIIIIQRILPCIKKKGKWVPKYRFRTDIGLHFGLKDPSYIGPAKYAETSRQVRKIIIHPDYDNEGILISYLQLYFVCHVSSCVLYHQSSQSIITMFGQNLTDVIIAIEYLKMTTLAMILLC